MKAMAPMRTHKDEENILDSTSDWATWLLNNRDVLPSSQDPHITDAIDLAAKFNGAVRAIEAEYTEQRGTRFSCGRLPART